jgi:thymidylate synthase
MLLSMAIEAKNIRIISREGVAALCSLWTPVDYLIRRIREAEPELLRPDGPLALIGGLYGGGLNVMLRNLHHNPQIGALILCGKDFSGASDHLKLFFEGRVSITGLLQTYVFDDGRSEELEKMVIHGPGASYTMDSLLRPEMFAARPEVMDLTGPVTPEVLSRISGFLGSYRPPAAPASRPAPVPLPRPRVRHFPSDPFSQAVSAGTIAEAWSEILSRLHRFGRPVRFRNGKERLELLNLKAVIERPGEMEEKDRRFLNLSEGQLAEYAGQLLSPDLDHGLPYTYGHRMRSHFESDRLAWAARDLSLAGDSRHALVTLWDNKVDPDGHDSPCLVSVFFRKIDGLVHLTALFRSHNGARAWPVNCVGLSGLMEFVCREANKRPERTEELELSPGRLTVVSMSISLDPADLPQIQSIVEEREARPFKTAMDPNGFFKISLDREAGLIKVFHHSQDGELLAEFGGDDPQEIGWRMIKSSAFSDPSHALYLGGQLERARRALRLGLDYEQDKAGPKAGPPGVASSGPEGDD